MMTNKIYAVRFRRAPQEANSKVMFLAVSHKLRDVKFSINQRNDRELEPQSSTSYVTCGSFPPLLNFQRIFRRRHANVRQVLCRSLP